MNEPKKLLLIDDDEETLQALVTYFNRRGYEVAAAPNGLEGLQILEAQHRDIAAVITDIVMPTVSGVGVISIVRKKYPQIPTVAITGWGEHPEALATEADADQVLKKPFELTELESVVERLLADKSGSV